MDGWIMVPIDRIVEQHAWPVSFTFRLQQHLMSLANGTSEHPSAMDKGTAKRPLLLLPTASSTRPRLACALLCNLPPKLAACMVSVN